MTAPIDPSRPHDVVSVDHGKCTVCGEEVLNVSTYGASKFIHKNNKQETALDLHERIVNLLISNFMPQTEEFDPASNLIVRRGVGSLVDDILRLAEDHYGVNQ